MWFDTDLTMEPYQSLADVVCHRHGRRDTAEAPPTRRGVERDVVEDGVDTPTIELAQYLVTRKRRPSRTQDA